MTPKRRSFAFKLLSLCLLASSFASAQNLPGTTQSMRTQPPEPPAGVIRVACIGDSITFGQGVQDRTKNSYPIKLGEALGDKYLSRNYGVNGTTALKSGDRPYVKRPIYQKVLDFKPDIAVIALGTNDSKPQNWQHKAQFAADYKSIIADLRAANPNVKVFVCLPGPCFLPGDDSIRDNVLTGEVTPLIKQIAQDEKATPIDLRPPLAGRSELYPDQIHPNADGAAIIADTVRRAITGG